MKRRARFAPGQLPGEAPRTGHHCPETSWWQPLGRPADAKLIREGELMPDLLGLQVNWEPAELSGPGDVPARAPLRTPPHVASHAAI